MSDVYHSIGKIRDDVHFVDLSRNISVVDLFLVSQNDQFVL